MKQMHCKMFIMLIGLALLSPNGQSTNAKATTDGRNATIVLTDVVNSKDLSKNLTKENLLNYLHHIPSVSKTLSGLFVYRNGTERNSGLETLQRITGKYPGIMATRMPSYSAGIEKWQSFVKEIISNWNNGFLVHIQWWEEANPLSQMEIFKPTQNSSINEIKWNNLIKEGGDLNKEWKKQLDSIVPYLRELHSAQVIPICSFLPKLNDKDYLWRGRPGVNGSLKLYKITHDYLTKHHQLNFLVWSWHLYVEGDMTNLEDYWAGKNYVDVASVQMWDRKQLSTIEYEKLLHIVGDKPISMECIASVPTVQLLTVQTKWTWFTLYDFALGIPFYNNDTLLNETFKSVSVINREDIDLLKTY